MWPTVCPGIVRAPNVLAVGDLHIENFGTWRDAEGRLVWGVNDFDEACYLPYTNDLVRLAASTLLAGESSQMHLSSARACEAILAGYTEALKAGGKPFVLEENDSWLRDIARNSLRDPVQFWKKMEALPAEETVVPESAIVAIEHGMAGHGLPYSIRHRVAGLGNLGKPRYVALAGWQGGKIAREAKALVPSASVWAKDTQGVAEIYYLAIMDRSIRCRDPFVWLQGHWIVRRLGPDCCRVELTGLPEESLEVQLLHAMGWETANIHHGSKDSIAAIRRDLKKRKPGWLQAAAEAMVAATQEDWQAWKAG